MRQRKVNHFSNHIAILTFVIALLVMQCIFCVFSVAAEEQTPACTALIDDYYEFTAPTAMAVDKDVIAVYDCGKVVIVGEEAISEFTAEVGTCFAMATTAGKVFLLAGDTLDSAVISAYCLDGTPISGVDGYQSVSDIAASNGMLYVLCGVNEFYEIDFSSDTPQVQSTASLARDKWSLFVSSYDGVPYLRTLYGGVVKKSASTYENLAASLLGVDDSLRGFCVMGQDVFTLIDGCIYKNGAAAPWLSTGNGDDKLTSVTDFAACDGKLYVLDGTYKAVKVYSRDAALVRYVGYAGTALGRLSAPVAMDEKDGTVMVADAGNARVCLFEGGKVKTLNGHLFQNITSVAGGSDEAYVVDAGNLCVFSSYTFDEVFDFAGKASWACVMQDGTVCVAAGSKVYCKGVTDAAFITLADFETDIYKVKSGIGGKVLYVQTADGLFACSLETGGRLSGQLLWQEGYIDFAVDYKGNAYVLTADGTVKKFARTPEGYAYDGETALGTHCHGYVSFDFSTSGNAYLLADNNVFCFEKTAFGVVTVADSDFEDNADEFVPVKVCVALDDCVAYFAPDNFENVFVIASGTKLMTYATVNYGGNDFYRVETTRGVAYVSGADVEVYQPGESNIHTARCLHTNIGVNIYKYPSHINAAAEAEVLYAALPKTEVFNVLGVVAADDGGDVWGFVYVEYKGQNGYVLSSDIVTVDNEPTVITRYRCKIKAEKLGRMVSLYEEASVNSKVVAKLADGSAIKSLEKIDNNNEFTKVIYDGKVCYVKTKCITGGGLTSGQLLAVILCAATVFATVCVVLIKRAGRRRKVN